jgi:hypothetical protein
MLGKAIRSGWPAHAIEAEARSKRGRASKDLKHLMAIRDAAKCRYYRPEERAADAAWLREKQAALDARDAIKATRATRPPVPPEYKSIRAACRSMLDVDRLSSAHATITTST